MTATRLEIAQAKAKKSGRPVETDLPPMSEGAYLLRAMLRLRPMRSNGVANVPVGWLEIDAFARATGAIDEPWEAELLYDMCEGYCAEIEAGTNPLSIAPMKRDNANDRIR